MMEAQGIETGNQEITFTRVFDAPREVVWKACTDPDLISRWWGTTSLTTTIEAMDVRPGGLWRIVQRDAEGNEYAFHRVYHEVTPFGRIVDTFEFEGMPGHVVLETDTFEDLGGGRTKMTSRLVFSSVEDRDAMLQSGMKEELLEAMDLLAELLDDLKARMPAAPAR